MRRRTRLWDRNKEGNQEIRNHMKEQMEITVENKKKRDNETRVVG